MKVSLAKLRKDYRLKGIDAGALPDDPFHLLQQWIEEAIAAKIPEPNAMVLSTSSKENKPSSRTVLLKGLDNRGLLFFTNYHSRKGEELNTNPHAGILFLWPELERQIRIEGKAETLGEAASDAYFAERPRLSQIGAWASPQSEEVAGREILENNFHFYEQKFQGQDVPRPPHWGGYRIVPDYFEFWQGRASRMHDRIVYKPTKNGLWKKYRIAP